MSTVLPATCVELQVRQRDRHVRVIDAPVSGGLHGAETGQLSIMVGGAAEDLDRVRPVLDLLGRNVFECGSLGSGQLTKIINNVVGIENIYGAAEAFALARSQGVSLDALVRVMEYNSGRNFFTEDVVKTRRNYAAWAESEATFKSLGDIIRKDLALASQMAGEAGLRVPVLDSVMRALSTIPDEVRLAWLSL